MFLCVVLQKFSRALLKWRDVSCEAPWMMPHCTSRWSKCRITCYQKSFFPDCIKRWNLLNNEAVNSTSINVSKSNLLSSPHYAHIMHSLEAAQYNNVLKGHNGKMTQFRLGLSPLRSELFTYNIIENPFCHVRRWNWKSEAFPIWLRKILRAKGKSGHTNHCFV